MSDEELSVKEQLNRAMAELGLSFTFHYIPQDTEDVPISDLSLKWRYALYRGDREIVSGTYAAGIAHAPSYQHTVFGRMSLETAAAVRYEVATGRTRPGGRSRPYRADQPFYPKGADVFACLLSDSDAIDYPSFESWADAFGFDEDSRKSEAIYKECVAIGFKLRAALGNEKLEELRAIAVGL